MDKKSFNVSISFEKSANRPAGRYVSDSAVLGEALHHGRLLPLYWSAAGQVQRESTAAGLPWFDFRGGSYHSFALNIDGQSLHSRWEHIGSSQRPGLRGTVEGVMELRHQVRPVSLKVVTRLDGTPIFARYLEITNTGTQPAALSSISPWAGLLWQANTDLANHHTNANPAFDPRTQAKFSVGYFANEDPLQEGHFLWQDLPQEVFRIERRAHGKSWAPPYYIARNNVSGAMFFIALSFSGPFFAEFIHRQNILSFRVGPAAAAPLRIIAPGETITSPEVHLGPLHGEMDQAVGHWHRHLRTSVVPPKPQKREMYTIGGRVVEEPDEWILREIDMAADMGCEAFMVDAGWYGEKFGGWPERRGDWFEGSWLPGGMKGLREHTHKKGMLFGLWQEPETATGMSKLRAAHPDWMLRRDDGENCTDALNLGHPQAAKFFEEAVTGVIRDHKLDFYKIDYNISPQEGGQNLVDGFAESEFYRHCEVLYHTFDRVLKEFPNCCVENCASGGGRLDLGMVARVHYSCQSDWSIHPYAIRSIAALTMFIPPENLCYYHNHVNWHGAQADQMADADTHLRVTLFALPIFVGFGAQDADRSTEFFRKTRRYVELHKGFCRPILARHPVVYHHTPDIGIFNPADWCVLEYAATDRTRAYAGLFKLTTGGQREFIFRPRGLDASRDYHVTRDNQNLRYRVSGAQLIEQGVRVELGQAMTSDLLMFEAVQEQP